MMRVVARGHDPAALRPARVIQLGLRGDIVIVVPQGGDPGHLGAPEQRKPPREGSPPARVVRRTHPVRIEIIARREDRGDRGLRGAAPSPWPRTVGGRRSGAPGDTSAPVSRIGPAPVAQHEGAQRRRLGGAGRQGEQADDEEPEHTDTLAGGRQTASPCPPESWLPTSRDAPLLALLLLPLAALADGARVHRRPPRLKQTGRARLRRDLPSLAARGREDRPRHHRPPARAAGKARTRPPSPPPMTCWQALARKWDCALLGPVIHQPEAANCRLWCDPRNALGAGLPARARGPRPAERASRGGDRALVPLGP
jgi:hypothetical protein